MQDGDVRDHTATLSARLKEQTEAAAAAAGGGAAGDGVAAEGRKQEGQDEGRGAGDVGASAGASVVVDPAEIDVCGGEEEE